MPTVYTATLAEQVNFERQCSSCAHKWTASFDIGVRGELAGSKEQASKSAQQIMYIEKKERFENREVLCPECSHFSVDAMYRHFRKAGYAGGILKQYKRAMWMNLLGFLGFAWIPALLLWLAKLNPLNSPVPWLSIIFLLIAVALGAVSLYKLFGFLWGLAAVSSVSRKVKQLSDDQLRELAIACYKGNKNSLDSTSFEEIKWNSWFTVPLHHKPS